MYRHYALVMLALVYAFSYMDRQITAILIDDLKLEFALTDTQLGLLSGLAFALFYATLGLPIARLADRHNRVKIISIAVAVWSVMTAISGMAQSFYQLLLARIGVGVGEAGASPPAHSIISDYYPPDQRAIALAIYSLGVVVGAVMGLAVGGYIAEHYGWRMAFIAAGLPGVLLAILVRYTVKEPVRGRFDAEAPAGEAHLSFSQSLRELWRNKVYRYVNGAHVAAVFFAYAMSSWLPALYLRQWDVSQSEVGAIVGMIVFLGGAPGMLIGGLLASYLGKRDPRWESWVASLALLFAIPAYLFALRTDSMATASVLFGIGTFLAQCSHAPGLAVIQSSVVPRRRAFAAAVMFFCSNMLGLGLGPLLVGYLSDLQLASTPGDSLAVALAVASSAFALGVIGYWYGGILWGRRRAEENAAARD